MITDCPQAGVVTGLRVHRDAIPHQAFIFAVQPLIVDCYCSQYTKLNWAALNEIIRTIPTPVAPSLNEPNPFPHPTHTLEQNAAGPVLEHMPTTSVTLSNGVNTTGDVVAASLAPQHPVQGNGKSLATTMVGPKIPNGCPSPQPLGQTPHLPAPAPATSFLQERSASALPTPLPAAPAVDKRSPRVAPVAKPPLSTNADGGPPLGHSFIGQVSTLPTPIPAASIIEE